MVFTTTNLFKGISCPYAEQCRLTSCIFSHDLPPSPSPDDISRIDPAVATQAPSQEPEESHEPATKRRKVTYDSLADKPLSKAEKIRNELAASRSSNGSASPPSRAPAPSTTLRQPPSLTKPVSPPTTNGKITSQAPVTGANNLRSTTHNIDPPVKKSEIKESLNPRMIPSPPESHAKRALYLKVLHTEMVRLNQQLARSSAAAGASGALVLSDHEIIRLALDEEESRARDQPKVYGNVIKQRITHYKKMKEAEWIEKVTAIYSSKQPKPAAKKVKIIDTGLTPDEEALILPHLIADQNPLVQFGYIPTPPTDAEAAEAVAAVVASANFEVCDRCTARFQVFPDRNEDGGLTSGGKCTYHPNRKQFPQRSKTDAYTGGKEPFYPCCGETVGASAGCTVCDSHVFKTSSPARLHAVCPFVETPENDQSKRDKTGREVKAISFDCEMGYTVFGLELIRLTAVSWPEGDELVDVLVRPVGTIIDLNSRFSGVWPEHFANAIPYQQWRDKPSPPPSDSGEPPPLPIVDSPLKARELLCSFLTPSTPLLGHAIDNDLNATRLCHPSIIDTVILFPHHRGLPLRFGLKMLSKKYLDRDIQMGGERGHDSKEDAIATGDLVRVKVGGRWKYLKATGWQLVNDQLVTPPPPKEGEVEGRAAGGEDQVRKMMEKAFYGHGKGAKRKNSLRGSLDGAADDSEEESTGSLAALLKRNSAPTM